MAPSIAQISDYEVSTKSAVPDVKTPATKVKRQIDEEGGKTTAKVGFHTKEQIK